jgi:hypothetical protein
MIQQPSAFYVARERKKEQLRSTLNGGTKVVFPVYGINRFGGVLSGVGFHFGNGHVFTVAHVVGENGTVDADFGDSKEDSRNFAQLINPTIFIPNLQNSHNFTDFARFRIRNHEMIFHECGLSRGWSWDLREPVFVLNPIHGIRRIIVEKLNVDEELLGERIKQLMKSAIRVNGASYWKIVTTGTDIGEGWSGSPLCVVRSSLTGVVGILFFKDVNVGPIGFFWNKQLHDALFKTDIVLDDIERTNLMQQIEQENPGISYRTQLSPLAFGNNMMPYSNLSTSIQQDLMSLSELDGLITNKGLERLDLVVQLQGYDGIGPFFNVHCLQCPNKTIKYDSGPYISKNPAYPVNLGMVLRFPLLEIRKGIIDSIQEKSNTWRTQKIAAINNRAELYKEILKKCHFAVHAHMKRVPYSDDLKARTEDVVQVSFRHADATSEYGDDTYQGFKWKAQDVFKQINPTIDELYLNIVNWCKQRMVDLWNNTNEKDRVNICT